VLLVILEAYFKLLLKDGLEIEQFNRGHEENGQLKQRERLHNTPTSHQASPSFCWAGWHKLSPLLLLVTDKGTSTVRLQSGPCIIQSPGLHLSILLVKR